MKPEAEWVVSVSEDRIACTRPDGLVESVTWHDLKAVVLKTTDEGPILADVFWMLIGDKGGCVIPQGATGEDALLSRLQALPGFKSDAVTAAMSSTENRRFLCWERDAQTL
jgi:hypothetical protein